MVRFGNGKSVQALTSHQNKSDSTKTVLKLSYIGNMGVLIESQGKTMLFDGFHKEYGPDYAYPTTSTVIDLQRGNYNDFSKIEVACVTHKHGDHFDPLYYKSFLEENREAIVVGPNQVKQEITGLKSLYKEKVTERIKGISYNDEIHTIRHQGVHVKAIQCNHVNQNRHASVENIAYLVEINGFKILHVGDTNWDLTEEVFKKLGLKENELDIAILPYWMLLTDSSKDRVEQSIAPKHVLATHIPPSFTKDEKSRLEQEFEGITLFTELGQGFIYNKEDQ